MNEGNITVVDVIATDDGYQLSRPAQDLYIAYEVVRRHIDSDGVRHYAQMSSAKITDDGYEFKFETGDVFTCASHEDRPASATVSDAIAGGGSGGGGVLVVHDVDDTLDKTWNEIDAADAAIIVRSSSADGVTVHMRDFVTSTAEEDGAYSVNATGVGRTTYETDSADGYPVRQHP